jgi:hypothetical protein
MPQWHPRSKTRPTQGCLEGIHLGTPRRHAPEGIPGARPGLVNPTGVFEALRRRSTDLIGDGRRAAVEPPRRHRGRARGARSAKGGRPRPGRPARARGSWLLKGGRGSFIGPYLLPLSKDSTSPADSYPRQPLCAPDEGRAGAAVGERGERRAAPPVSIPRLWSRPPSSPTGRASARAQRRQHAEGSGFKKQEPHREVRRGLALLICKQQDTELPQELPQELRLTNWAGRNQAGIPA